MPKFLKGDYIPENAEKYVGAKKPYYRSSWELAFMKMCDSHPYITQWASENLKIPYRHPVTGKHTVMFQTLQSCTQIKTVDAIWK